MSARYRLPRRSTCVVHYDDPLAWHCTLPSHRTRARGWHCRAQWEIVEFRSPSARRPTHARTCVAAGLGSYTKSSRRPGRGRRTSTFLRLALCRPTKLAPVEPRAHALLR